MLQNDQPQRNNTSFRAAVTYLIGLTRPRLAATSRHLIYRTIVERHIGKHTGLRYQAKACPYGPAVVVSGRRRRPWPKPRQPRAAPRAANARRRSPIREEGYGCFAGQYSPKSL